MSLLFLSYNEYEVIRLKTNELIDFLFKIASEEEDQEQAQAEQELTDYEKMLLPDPTISYVEALMSSQKKPYEVKRNRVKKRMLK